MPCAARRDDRIGAGVGPAPNFKNVSAARLTAVARKTSVARNGLPVADHRQTPESVFRKGTFPPLPQRFPALFNEAERRPHLVLFCRIRASHIRSGALLYSRAKRATIAFQGTGIIK
jgi:hypothetical protein